ncbi:melanoma-associated antigen E1 [Galendromus occidentalis]|uniref:Melanoma-associated antigen E1 n=1 Tax=Galendromus occidentalis TaxID=34638 RepID=A0AAJ6VUV1_9ACAR|nr:melanoma-associated antigen E1 [Galendromus occidentalis]
MSHSLDLVASLASNLAHMLLIQEKTKLGLKKSDIINQVLRGHAEDRASTTRLLKEVLEEASRLLENAFGYKIKEIPGKALFILVNTLDFEQVEQFLEIDGEWKQIRGFLCIVLSFILMSGGEIRDEQLWDFLRNLNVAEDDKSHPTLGDVEKLVKTTFVRWHYLDLIKERQGLNSFRWGVRAEHEFNKMEMLNFVASIYGDGRTARDFTGVFRRLEEEAQAAQSSESMNESFHVDE